MSMKRFPSMIKDRLPQIIIEMWKWEERMNDLHAAMDLTILSEKAIHMKDYQDNISCLYFNKTISLHRKPTMYAKRILWLYLYFSLTSSL